MPSIYQKRCQRGFLSVYDIVVVAEERLSPSHSGLSHDQNMAKMRLLTFMGMAVEFKEISFDTMQQELQIGADDVEAFVIDGKPRPSLCERIM